MHKLRHLLEKMTPAPIALFTYNRLAHTRQTVAALAANELAAQSPLIVFSDGPKSPEDATKVELVREFIKSVAGFKSVDLICQAKNSGLSKSIIRGVTEVCRLHGRVIVVEDDLVTAPFFLRYMNDALELYEKSPEVACVSGYVYPVSEPLPETFFLKGAECWGWATWQRGWDHFEPDGARLLKELETRGLNRVFDYNGALHYSDMLRDQIAGKVDSWAIRWHAAAFLRDKLTLYPGRSLVQNIGMDGSGRHCGATDVYAVPLAKTAIHVASLPRVASERGRLAFERYFRLTAHHPSAWRRSKTFIGQFLPRFLIEGMRKLWPTGVKPSI